MSLLYVDPAFRSVMRSCEENAEHEQKERHHMVRRVTMAELDCQMVKMKYAVRGAVAAKAGEVTAKLANGDKLPFDKIIPCNIGNPHAVQQKPITFYRQVAACCLYPELCGGSAGSVTDTFTEGMKLHAKYTDGEFYQAEVVTVSDSPKRAKAPVKVHYVGYSAKEDAWLSIDKLKSKKIKSDSASIDAGMPADVKARAKEYLKATGGSGMGAYTNSTGLELVRKQVCAFIERRDGFPADPESIQLTTGASEGVKRCLGAIIAKENDCIMIPRPQYPLYSAAITQENGKMVYYHTEEEKDWNVTREELDRSFTEGEADGHVDVLGIAIINPGNPTGGVLSEEDVEMFITFARDKSVVVMADEVYQENVYAEGKKFHSFKKVLRKLQAKDDSYKKVQLISFHSTSKGIIGECGQRGGYAEFIGFSPATMAQFSKVAATSLSSNTLGQVFVGLMVTPPKKGDPSFPLFDKECTALLSGLKDRSKMLTKGLNDIPGISTREIQGAMYSFAKVEIPTKAVEHCKAIGTEPDEFWCIELVEKTGIVCVPGSGFGQKEGTYHFRITILPPADWLKDMLVRLTAFQADFTKEWQ